MSPHGRALTRCLCDTNVFVRTSAVDALCHMGADSGSYATDLALACRDSEADVRRKAAEGLGRIGASASQYILDLVHLLKDPDVGCRRCAAEAMLKMGMAAAPYAHDLAELLDDDAVSLRWTLVDGLRNLGAAGAEALSGLLTHRNPIVRETASATLQQMGWQLPSPSGMPPINGSSPRSFRYKSQAEVGVQGSMPSHVLMRIRGPEGFSQSASPRLYRRPVR